MAEYSLAGLFLPKVDDAAQVAAVSDLLRRFGRTLRLAPMIESAAGLINVHAIATGPDVVQLHLGEMDLATDLQLRPDAVSTELAHARSLLVLASRGAGLVPPSAPVSPVINDADFFSADTVGSPGPASTVETASIHNW